MRNLKFKAQPTNAFFATVNQMFGGSSQPPTTAERAVTKSLCTVQTTKQCSAVVVSWEKPPNIWLTAAKNAFVGRLLNFRVRMLLKSAVMKMCFWTSSSDFLTLLVTPLRTLRPFPSTQKNSYVPPQNRLLYIMPSIFLSILVRQKHWALLEHFSGIFPEN